MSDPESLLPIVQHSDVPQSEKLRPDQRNFARPSFDWKNRLAVACRMLLLLLIVVGIRFRESTNLANLPDRHQVTLPQARLLDGNATQVGPASTVGQQVDDVENRILGTAISTIPEANFVVGYRGTSHCLLLINDHNEVIQVALLNSRDTIEHVELIQKSELFWSQFIGWKLGSPKSLPDTDAVSGATLTSLAIAEGIALRLGQLPGSLKFPDAITTEEISIAWPELTADAAVKNHGSHVVVHNDQDTKLGTLIRTGAFSDSIAGYQGPTELLVILDSDDRVQTITKRRTWDNEPYASYLDDEPWFWDPFLGSKFATAGDVDLEELGVEGISGATMTSLAAADTFIAAAKEWKRRQQLEADAKDRNRIHWTTNDIGSVVVVFIGCIIAFTRLRSWKQLSRLWNVVLVIYFGLFTGNLVSLVVIFGWSACGIAYQLAPGLTLVVVSSFLLPAMTKRNVYCSHLCPHGAAQQLLRNRLPKEYRLPKPLMRWLTWIPGALLVLATITVIVSSTFDLAAIEPFNAYIWYVSGTSSIVLATVSLFWSTFEPMAWCRYGCATGRLLNYVRLSASSAKPTFVDAVALGLAAASIFTT